MKKLKLKSKKQGVFLVCGIIMFIITVIILAATVLTKLRREYFAENGVPATATITSITAFTDADDNVTYYVHYDYEYEGTAYSSKTSFYRRGMQEGGQIEILVDPKKPSRSMADPIDANEMIMLIPAGLFLAGGAAFMIFFIRG